MCHCFPDETNGAVSCNYVIRCTKPSLRRTVSHGPASPTKTSNRFAIGKPKGQHSLHPGCSSSCPDRTVRTISRWSMPTRPAWQIDTEPEQTLLHGGSHLVTRKPPFEEMTADKYGTQHPPRLRRFFWGLCAVVLLVYSRPR